MARRRRNTFNLKVINAVFSTPFILLGATKRKRKNVANKWLKILTQATKM